MADGWLVAGIGLIFTGMAQALLGTAITLSCTLGVNCTDGMYAPSSVIFSHAELMSAARVLACAGFGGSGLRSSACSTKARR